MNENNIPQIGDPPRVDRDLGMLNAGFTRGIRKQILLGNFDAEPGADEEMLRAFKGAGIDRANGAEVDKFLDNWNQ